MQGEPILNYILYAGDTNILSSNRVETSCIANKLVLNYDKKSKNYFSRHPAILTATSLRNMFHPPSNVMPPNMILNYNILNLLFKSFSMDSLQSFVQNNCYNTGFVWLRSMKANNRQGDMFWLCTGGVFPLNKIYQVGDWYTFSSLGWLGRLPWSLR